MKNQIKKLVKLIKENPELPVKLMVDNEELAEDFTYTNHEIKSVKISDWIEENEKFYTDIDNYVDDLCCWNEELRDQDAVDIANEKYIKVILITTRAC